MRIEFCNSCGAPLEARWNKIVLVCQHCGSQNAPGTVGEPVPSSFPDDGRLRFALDGRAYLIDGLIARGDSSDVFFGRWVRRLGEQVVVKILRCSNDRDLVRNESSILTRLFASPASGTPYFTTLIPEPIAAGPVHFNQGERIVSIFRWNSGFLHTLAEIKESYPDGVEAPIVVWVLKRILEILHWSHLSGVIHGAVLPPHVLVHPRDHGAMLIGWSTAAIATNSPSNVPAVSRGWKQWYPTGKTTSFAADVAMAARCALGAAGASTFSDAGTLPSRVADLVIRAARMEFEDAWQLRDLVSQQAINALGPPAYHPLQMPGSMTGNKV